MWFEFVVLCIVFEILLELLLNYRQLKHLKKTTKPVDIFKDEITIEEFGKSVDYQIALTKFDIFTTLVSPGFTTPFLIKFLWDFTNYGGEIIHSNLFALFISVIETIISIPFSYYRKFVIDEKFGFNNSTLKLFITDSIKNFILGNVLNGILYTVLIWLYTWAGHKFILYAGGFFFAFVVILQIAYPIFIMPLFTKLSPLPDGEVKTSINALAEETKFNLKEIYQTDDSKRSSKQNAFMFGLFTHKVALADTLLEKCTADEIKAVVGHEIGHSKHLHIWKLIFLNQVSFAITCLSLDMVLKSSEIFAEFGFTSQRPFMIGMILTTLFAIPITKLLQLPINMIIRHFEYQADEYSASRGLKLEQALLRISQENKNAVEPEYLYSAFNDSHPTLYQRCVEIRKIQKKSK